MSLEVSNFLHVQQNLDALQCSRQLTIIGKILRTCLVTAMLKWESNDFAQLEVGTKRRGVQKPRNCYLCFYWCKEIWIASLMSVLIAALGIS